MSDETAMDRWYAKYEGRRDHPRVSVWYPSALPYGRLQTITVGCEEPDILPNGPIIGGVNIAGIDFQGPLDDIELLFAAAAEELARIREIADEMRAAESKL